MVQLWVRIYALNYLLKKKRKKEERKERKKRNAISWPGQNKDTDDRPYLQLPCLQFTSLLNFFPPQIHPHSTFTVTRGHVWPMVKSVSRPMHVSWPSLSKATRCLPAPLSFYQQVFYSWSPQCQFPTFFNVCWSLLVISRSKTVSQAQGWHVVQHP